MFILARELRRIARLYLVEKLAKKNKKEARENADEDEREVIKKEINK